MAGTNDGKEAMKVAEAEGLVAQTGLLFMLLLSPLALLCGCTQIMRGLAFEIILSPHQGTKNNYDACKGAKNNCDACKGAKNNYDACKGAKNNCDACKGAKNNYDACKGAKNNYDACKGAKNNYDSIKMSLER